MKRKKAKITSYESLMTNYYGNIVSLRSRMSVTSHGFSVMSGSFDTGEVLVQKNAGSNYDEYVVQSSMDGDNRYDEYVVQSSMDDGNYNDYSVQSSMDGDNRYDEYVVQRSTDDGNYNEYVVQSSMQDYDLAESDNMFAPDASSGARYHEIYPVIESEKKVSTQSEILDRIEQNDKISGDSNPVSTTKSMRTIQPVLQREAGEDTKKTTMSDDEFMADMQSILTGQKVFDPMSKQTVEKDKLGASMSQNNTPRQTNNAPEKEIKNEHAIFDKIAQSMQYANAYDLGTVELDNRFEDFDRILNHKNKVEQIKTAPKNLETQQTAESAVGSKEFLQDLDAIRNSNQSVNNNGEVIKNDVPTTGIV